MKSYRINQEAYNLMSAISGALLAEYNIFMRSSTLGRKSLKRIIETEKNPLEIKRLELKDNYINANADIFNCKFKTIGLKLEFVTDKDSELGMVEDVVSPLQIGKYVIYDTPLKKEMYTRIFLKYTKLMEIISFMESYPGEKSDYIWDKTFEDPEVKEYNLDDDVKEMLKLATKNRGTSLNDGVNEL